MAQLLIKRKSYTRKSYTRKDGTRVKATQVPSSTFKVKDRGKPGRTPESQRFYHPKVRTGWSKDLSQKVRIAKVVEAHKGDILASARGLQALANVTTDRETKLKARTDAKVLFKRYANIGRS